MPMDNMDTCVVCNKEVGDEAWYAVGTGDIGSRPHERFEVLLCAECAATKLTSDFRKTVKALFEEYG